MISKNKRRRITSFNPEQLESRTLMSVTYGTNLVQNPGAETFSGTADGSTVITPAKWTANGDPTVAPYSTFTTITKPSGGGNVYFTGGPDSAETDLFQTIDLSSVGTAIDAGTVKFNLSAFLGGFGDQDDSVTVFANFQSASHGFVNSASIGPVLAVDRNNVTAMLSRSSTGPVPKTTRFAQIQLHFSRASGSYNDGYADNASLILTNTATTTGSIAGTVFNDADGNGSQNSGETGLAGVKVFLDKNNNGTLDSGETSLTTPTGGAYKFSNLSAGTYAVREIVPSTYRATTTNPVSTTLAAGANVTGKNFGDSQTALVTGTVFIDANNNKKKDTGETGLAGVVVYLDFNNNGQLDSFELKTTTNSAGQFSFTLPFGTYTVRQVIPTGYTQTVAPVTLTVAKGAVSALNLFGDKHV